MHWLQNNYDERTELNCFNAFILDVRHLVAFINMNCMDATVHIYAFYCGIDVDAAIKDNDNVTVELENNIEVQTVKSKRPIKLTYKALAETVEKLQNVRKSKLTRLKKI